MCNIPQIIPSRHFVDGYYLLVRIFSVLPNNEYELPPKSMWSWRWDGGTVSSVNMLYVYDESYSLYMHC